MLFSRAVVRDFCFQFGIFLIRILHWDAHTHAGQNAKQKSERRYSRVRVDQPSMDCVLRAQYQKDNLTTGIKTREKRIKKSTQIKKTDGLNHFYFRTHP